jgi:CheY-like chemotaxis protein
MFDWLRRNKSTTVILPEIPFDEIRKRARLLVIDDQGFNYKALFEKDGYSLTEWRDVEDLSKLENNFFDIILLDVNGVGKLLSNEQGLGVLQHIRQSSPAQLVIAFSNAKFDLKYQTFFELADATLSKDIDYVDFKRKVDELLRKRFSAGFYTLRIANALGNSDVSREVLHQEVSRSMLHGDASPVLQFIKQKTSDPKTIATCVGIVKAGIEVYKAWKH